MHFFKPPSFGAARVSIEFNLQCCQPTDNFINQQFPYIDVINYLLNFLFSALYASISSTNNNLFN